MDRCKGQNWLAVHVCGSFLCQPAVYVGCSMWRVLQSTVSYVYYSSAGHHYILCSRTMRISGSSTYYTHEAVCYGHAALGRCGDFELKLIYNVQFSQPNHLYSLCRRAFLYVYMYMYMNYLRRSIFLAAHSIAGYLPGN